MMRTAQTNSDIGRIAEGDTPCLRYRVVDGVVELWEPREPDTPRPVKAELSKTNGLAKQLIAEATGTAVPCSCGKFAKWIKANGIEDVDALAHRLMIEARRRVDELYKQADEAEERADAANEAVKALTIERARIIIINRH